MKGVFRRLKCNVFFLFLMWKNNICYDIKNEICYILTKISLHENLVIVGSVTSWRGRRHIVAAPRQTTQLVQTVSNIPLFVEYCTVHVFEFRLSSTPPPSSVAVQQKSVSRPALSYSALQWIAERKRCILLNIY